MAAPCRRMASRSVLMCLTSFRRAAVDNKTFRQFFSTSICRAASQTKCVREKANSPWTLMAAVCLQRLPVISADCSPIEQRYRQMVLQVRSFSLKYHLTVTVKGNKTVGNTIEPVTMLRLTSLYISTMTLEIILA